VNEGGISLLWSKEKSLFSGGVDPCFFSCFAYWRTQSGVDNADRTKWSGKWSGKKGKKGENDEENNGGADMPMPMVIFCLIYYALQSPLEDFPAISCCCSSASFLSGSGTKVAATSATEWMIGKGGREHEQQMIGADWRWVAENEKASRQRRSRQEYQGKENGGVGVGGGALLESVIKKEEANRNEMSCWAGITGITVGCCCWREKPPTQQKLP
jgi:hypothetical protein